VATLVGVIAGKTQRLDTCSGMSCDAALEPGLWECPRCLGEIAGEIRKESDRLAAEETLRPRLASQDDARDVVDRIGATRPDR
jgi:hypothetical protein